MRGLFMTIALSVIISSDLYSQSGSDSSYYTKAFEYFDRGEYEKAGDFFSLSIKEGYKTMKSYMFRGVSELLRDRMAEAASDLHVAMKMDPSNSDVNFYTGRLYFFRKQYDSAIRFCRKAVLLDSTDADYFDGLAMSYLGVNRYNLALNNADRAIRLTPANVTYINNRGIIKETMGMYNEAIEDFKKGLELSPYDNTEMANIAFCLYNLKKFDDALAICNQVIGKDAKMPLALLVRGQIYHALGSNEKSCTDFRNLSLLGGEYGRQGAEYSRKYCK